MVKEHPGVGVVDLSGGIDGWCCCAEVTLALKMV